MANQYCTSCGTQLGETQNFCIACGRRMGRAAISSAPAAEDVERNQVISQPVQHPAAPRPRPPQHTSPALDPRPAAQSKYAPIRTGGYLGIMLLMLIPVVNIILLILWALGSCQKVNKRSFARATLIFGVIIIALSLVAGYFIKIELQTLAKTYGLTQDKGEEANGFGLWGLLEAWKSIPGLGNLSALPGEWDETTLREAGISEKEINMLRAVGQQDRQALWDQGYSEEETDQLFQLTKGKTGSLLGIQEQKNP